MFLHLFALKMGVKELDLRSKGQTSKSLDLIRPHPCVKTGVQLSPQLEVLLSFFLRLPNSTKV